MSELVGVGLGRRKGEGEFGGGGGRGLFRCFFWLVGRFVWCFGGGW